MNEAMQDLYNLKEGEELTLDFKANEDEVGFGPIEQRWLRIPTNDKSERRFLVITRCHEGFDIDEVWIPEPDYKDPDRFDDLAWKVEDALRELEINNTTSIPDFVKALQQASKKARAGE